MPETTLDKIKGLNNDITRCERALGIVISRLGEFLDDYEEPDTKPVSEWTETQFFILDDLLGQLGSETYGDANNILKDLSLTPEQISILYTNLKKVIERVTYDRERRARKTPPTDERKGVADQKDSG